MENLRLVTNALASYDSFGGSFSSGLTEVKSFSSMLKVEISNHAWIIDYFGSIDLQTLTVSPIVRKAMGSRVEVLHLWSIEVV